MSDIPMPVHKQMLATFSAIAFSGNLIIHIYSYFSQHYKMAAYMLLALDLLTILPAIFFSGLISSPFILVLPLTIYTVYFVNFEAKACTLFGIITLAAFLVLVIISWNQVDRFPAWAPSRYPEYALFVGLVQLSALAAIIYQSRQFPSPLVRDLHLQEAILAQQRHKAELGTSISMIVHEIRNPMATISLTVEQIQNSSKGAPKPLRDKLEHYWNICRGEITRIDEMLESTLSYARERKGKYNFSSIGARKAIDRAIQFMTLKYGRHQLPFSSDCTISDAQLLYCDPDSLHQVLVNLIDNAIQGRSPERQLRLEIGAAERDGWVILTIRDNGTGIAQSKLPYIFDSYITDRAGGTGLGLAIIQQIIKDHKGSISVTSTENVGTTFIIHLPSSAADPSKTGTNQQGSSFSRNGSRDPAGAAEITAP